MSTPTAGVSDCVYPNVQELYSQYQELESLQIIDTSLTPSEVDLEDSTDSLNILTPISVTPVYGR